MMPHLYSKMFLRSRTRLQALCRWRFGVFVAARERSEATDAVFSRILRHESDEFVRPDTVL